MRISSLARPALLAAFAAFLASCERTSDTQPVTPTGSGNNVYITNEGAFGNANGSVTLFDKTSNTATANLFQNANGRALGDVVESMTVAGNSGYVVVNNSNKVEVVSLPSFRSAATISTVTQPRYMVANTTTNRGYITEWLSSTAGRVSVIDLGSNAVVGTLPTGRYPEKPLLYNNIVYVPNSDENTLTLIDAAQQKVTSTLTVSDGPGSLVADKNGNIWVLCSGITRYQNQPPYAVISSTPGALIRFSPGAPTQQLVLPFAASSSPSGLRISPDGSQLYYHIGKRAYRMDVTATTLPTTPFLQRTFSALSAFYGFDIDPKDNTLYVLNASFTGPSQLVRYRLSATTATPIDSFSTGIGSNGAAFY